ncbi:two-partner secretion domain-containing protein, partial [Pseudomonas lopnurensis]|uniref:two-partner secretion domain-containing protein n=1 Tax=Pseudomonas lopnurensis TaxID=1477517 RepID=UPI0018792AFA
MNRTYALVWNPSLGAWSVTDEHARRRAKGAGAILAASLLLPLTAIAADLPTGGQVVSGSGQIGTPSNSQMVIDQASNKLAIDWQSFDIGAGNKVTFNQPGTDSIALNRVLGADGSKIMGQLDANGRVFIINPNGVLFSQGAQVNVGGLVASTLDLSNSDFEAGNYQFKGNGSNASVINNGQITAADGGSVALLGGTVSNNGVIVANQGSVTLAAGNAMTLDFAGDGLLNVQVDEALVDALVENHQLIRADGGQVLLTANAGEALLKTVVNNTGVIEARTLGEKDGKIVLLGDFDGGTVQVAGTLDASAPNGGNGGFVDTSGAHVQIQDGTRVTTLAADGKTGEWLIDPTDFTVSAGSAAHTGSGIGADTLSNNLNSTSVILQTMAADNGTDKGDIHVNADITYTANQLTLTAHNAINLNAVINVNGSGTLAMNHGAGSINASFGESGGFKGKVNFAGSGAGLLTINGAGYTVIKNMSALQGMVEGNYALGGDLDASNVANFAPIGFFTGTFDGLGHTISGLTINRPDQGNVGLFGSIIDATLRNVGLEGGSMTGKDNVGGLAGYNSSSHIHHVYATSSVTGVTTEGDMGSEGGLKVGGLVGFMYSSLGSSASISHAYATGAVTGSSNVGGLVGSNSSIFGSSNSSISHAYATGAVTGSNNVGGLVGSNSSSYDSSNSSISHAYATGAVTGSSNVGGLVGSNSSLYSNNSSISHAYATGAVTGPSNVGGLVGDNSSLSGGGTSITDSFWDTNTTGQSGSAGGGTGKSTAEMQSKATYAGWDFDSTWRIGATGAGTDGYAFYGLPTLQGVTRKTDYQYFDSGLGTEASPWTLANWQQLQNINTNATTLAGYFQLKADLDQNSQGYHSLASATANDGAGWKPLGDGSSGTDDTRFTGTLKGQGHTIGDLVVNVTRPSFTAGSGTTNSYAGLFGMTSSGAWIEQVGLIDARVSASGADTNQAGALVGAVSGSTTITQNYVSNANVTASGGQSSYAGGLLGRSSGIYDIRPNINQNYASGHVSALDGSSFTYAGGLVGSIGGGDIDDSYASVIATATSENGDYTYAGGLIASLVNSSQFRTTVTNSFWDSNLTSESKGGTGKTTEQLQQLQTFTDAGWDIDDAGGTGKVWRIYEGQTGPLLRGFLKQVTVTADTSSITGKTYDGTAATGTATYSTNVPGAALDGTLSYATNSKNAATYSTADNSLTISKRLYSGQQGYDISYASTNTSLTIDKADLAVSGISANNKTYDATN